jgi:hypothetical protein
MEGIAHNRFLRDRPLDDVLTIRNERRVALLVRLESRRRAESIAEKLFDLWVGTVREVEEQHAAG